jgi:small subunit ribosomal protein S8
MRIRDLFQGCASLRGNYFIGYSIMDSIANMLTALLNAQRVGKTRVAVPYSSFKEQLAALLQSKGLVSSIRVQEGVRPQIIMTLAYDEESGRPRIQGVKRLSTPGRRRYVKQGEVPYPVTDAGAIVVSTSAGLMDDRQARGSGVGGELVCEIW